jgi:hypothetical protein
MSRVWDKWQAYKYIKYRHKPEYEIFVELQNGDVPANATFSAVLVAYSNPKLYRLIID